MRHFISTDGLYNIYFDDYLMTYVYEKRFIGWDLVWLREEQKRQKERYEQMDLFKKNKESEVRNEN